MKKILVTLIVMLAGICIPVLAAAEVCPPVTVDLNVASEQYQAWWMVLLDFLVQLSAPIVTMILGVLGTWLVRKLTSKWDAEKQTAVLRLMDNLLIAGVSFAEEQAHKGLRAGNARTEGAEKLQTALAFVQQQLVQSNLPSIAEEELKKLIEARVQQERTKPDGVLPSDPPKSSSPVSPSEC